MYIQMVKCYNPFLLYLFFLSGLIECFNAVSGLIHKGFHSR